MDTERKCLLVQKISKQATGNHIFLLQVVATFSGVFMISFATDLKCTIGEWKDHIC